MEKILSNLRNIPNSKKSRKRVGRGPSSGHGKTATKGHKGQNARSGGGVPPYFEGGQMPLIRRLPKRGFNNPFRKEYTVINLKILEYKFNDGEEVTIEALKERKIIKKVKDGVKILGNGEINKKLIFSGLLFSKTAKEKILKAGGTINE